MSRKKAYTEKQLIPEIPSMLEKDQTNAVLNTKLDLDISVCNDEWAEIFHLKKMVIKIFNRVIIISKIHLHVGQVFSVK